MSWISRFEQVTSWKRALNAARRTVGKEPLDKEPSDKWKASILLAEHSPIREVVYDWTWSNIKQWVTVHLVRHWLGINKYVHSQRIDRRQLADEYGVETRDALPQGAENEMDMNANAMALINVSRVRLCNCASKETREAWQQVWDKIYEHDPIMASKMVKNCIYRGFCPELKCCGYVNTPRYKKELEFYRRKDITEQDVKDFYDNND